MKGAKELAEMLRTEAGRCTEVHALVIGRAGALEIAAHLDAKAAIDSAVPGEVGEIIERHATMQGALHHLGATNADTFPAIREHRDRGILLAIVQRHAGEMALVTAERDSARMDRRDLAAKVEQLTDRLRMMQHGEAEALKMIGSEKLMVDQLAAEVERYSQREIAYTHIDPLAEKLPAPLACPNCDRRDTWCEFLGDSGLMRCEKHSGGCGYSMSLDANEPENLRQARDLLRAEVETWKRSHSSAAEQLVSAEMELRGLYEEPDMEPAPVIRRLRTETGVTILRLRGEATEQRERAEMLARGLAAYRVGGYTAGQVWENGEGKTVPR